MKERFGTPYVVVDYPYGVSATERFLERVCESLDKEADQEFMLRERAKVKESVEKV